MPTKLTAELAKREARKRRASERHAVGCCGELGRRRLQFALADLDSVALEYSNELVCLSLESSSAIRHLWWCIDMTDT
jgi:hypothetical protein